MQQPVAGLVPGEYSIGLEKSRNGRSFEYLRSAVILKVAKGLRDLGLFSWRVFLGTWPAFVPAVVLSLKVWGITLLLSTVVATLLAVVRIYRPPILYWIVSIFIQLFRSTPLLVQLYFFYFGLPYVGVMISEMGVALLAVTLINAAFSAEIIRAGIESIHRTQFDAGHSLGLSFYNIMRHIILPQAFRKIIPPLTGQFTLLIKGTALLSVIALREITETARSLSVITFRPLESFLPAIILYLAATLPLFYVSKQLERSWARHGR